MDVIPVNKLLGNQDFPATPDQGANGDLRKIRVDLELIQTVQRTLPRLEAR